MIYLTNLENRIISYLIPKEISDEKHKNIIEVIKKAEKRLKKEKPFPNLLQRECILYYICRISIRN